VLQDSDKTFSEDEEDSSPKTEREMILAEAKKPLEPSELVSSTLFQTHFSVIGKTPMCKWLFGLTFY